MSEFDGSARNPASARLDWVDTAKGFCIILVVLMHVAGGFEGALQRASWIDPFIDWAKQFRMPGFFLLSGLLAPRVVGRDWPDFLDRRIAPFAYFYLLWLAINCLLRFPVWGEGGVAALLGSFALGLVEPFGMLWFIYMLAVFFMVTKAVRRYPAIAWPAAALLALTPVTTGWMVVDAFAAYYVFFLSGALFAPRIATIAEWVGRNRGSAALLWLGWLAASVFLTGLGGYAAISATPGGSLVLGHAGALGLITLSVLLAGRMGWLGYCGQRTLPIYLAFFIPMALTRALLLRSGVPFDIGAAALLATALSVALPLVAYRLVKGTALGFLFERPRAFRIAPRPAEAARAVAVESEIASAGVNVQARR